MGKVYHASPIQELRVISPNKWEGAVFASKKLAVAAAFLGRTGGDYTCGLVFDNGVLDIVERFEGALDLRYSLKGSIYVLGDSDFYFKDGMWSEEVRCDRARIPSEEIKVGKAIDYLMDLESKGEVRIYHFPERPSSIPEDDSDLVLKSVNWIREGKDNVWDLVRNYHPRLVSRIEEGLNGED